MEAAFFEAWLGAIVSLSEAQRQRAFEALALSEVAITAGAASQRRQNWPALAQAGMRPQPPRRPA
jgi:hypothetical protein